MRNSALVSIGFIVTCTAMDELAKSASNLDSYLYVKGYSTSEAGTCTGPAPANEVDFLSKIGTGQDDFHPDSSTTFGDWSPVDGRAKPHLQLDDALDEPHATHIRTSLPQSNREDPLCVNSHSHFRPQDPPQTLYLLHALERGSRPDTSAQAEDTLRQTMVACRPTQTNKDPVQVGNGRNHLPTTAHVRTGRKINTSGNQAGCPYSKKMRVTTLPSTGHSSSQPATTDNNEFKQQEVVSAIGSIPNSHNQHVIQTSRTGYHQALRLHFGYDVLETRNSLIEDPIIIAAMKEFQQGEKLIIEESKFEAALIMFRYCAKILSVHARHDLRHRYPGNDPRKTYIAGCYKIYLGKYAHWLAFWKDITQNNLTDVNSQKSRRAEELRLLFLYYVKMIDTIIPDPKNEGVDSPEHNSELFRKAIEIFEKIHTTPNLSADQLEIVQEGYKKPRLAPLRDTHGQCANILWRWLRVWIDNSGRDYLRNNFFKDYYTTKSSQVFFNKIFCLSIVHYNERILDYPFKIHHQ
ncbi:hypothetical protein Pst134EA_022403 [Puccinia striiformis f. sp. tritici]|nr:hypothetical protein Pst134EA_022403 [Puccinia striiformis f. sp. tritici]KAH9454913.1 hypothetical protein Pst134EA_022403 [Puccinia striiformis f. sp. tritici]